MTVKRHCVTYVFSQRPFLSKRIFKNKIHISQLFIAHKSYPFGHMAIAIAINESNIVLFIVN